MSTINPIVQWTDELSVGIGEIDEQHKVLVGLINELHDAIWHKHGREACNEILFRLVEYTRVHFMVEEVLMRLLRYPDYTAHKLEHDKLILQVEQLVEKLKTGEANISFELLQFLIEWVSNHIKKSDASYTAHFATYKIDMGPHHDTKATGGGIFSFFRRKKK